MPPSRRHALNQAPVTGESLPVEKGPGDALFAGSVNSHGSLELVALDRLGEAEAAAPGAVAELAQQLLAELLLQPVKQLERRRRTQGAQAGEG
jgi:hypothetical protein